MLCLGMYHLVCFAKLTYHLAAEQKAEHYRKMREELKKVDKEDKLLQRKHRREKRIKEKMKWKKNNAEEDNNDISGSEVETADRHRKRSKTYFDSDSDDSKKSEVTGKGGISTNSVTLEEQEALALKLLNSMHS